LFMSQPSLLCSESGINNTLFCRRLPNAVLLMFRLYSKTIEAFDYRTNSWITVHTHPSLENPMSHLFLYSTVFLGRCFYIVGGGLRWTDPFNRVWRYNLVTHAWQEMSPMQESRALMSVTELKGYIYAMGGCRDDHVISLRNAERYQPNINQWTFIASMNEERIRASCTTLNNKIYICGGLSNRVLNTADLEDSMTHLFLYSTVFLGRCFYIVGGGLSWTDPCIRVWRFNLVTHTWQEMSPMQEPRYLMSVTVLKGYIYAMGGCRDDDVISHRTAERYQPNINQWTFIASMNFGRSYASCTTLNNKIYICGGMNNRVLNTAEYYNPDTNQWTLITPMGTHRYKLGVVAYMVFKDIRRTNV
uniref:Kelch like family member 10 n=1 Tax=Gouania willdenowi TaxID=441366 RepID=A0A8C5GRW2_GOUWI